MTGAATGTLHLIPVTLGGDVRETLPASTLEVVRTLDYFIVENEKSARHFLRAAGHPLPLQQLEIKRFDRRADEALAQRLLSPLQGGRSAGVLSEAGCPAVADPGALLVAVAHSSKLRVVAHIGPNSLLLALMVSGCNGQRFQFHGYLPVAPEQCRAAVRDLERESRLHDRTEIFIETPYRSDVLLKAVLAACTGNTRLCVATDLTLSTESVYSMRVTEWKKQKIEIGRRPSVFLLDAG